MADCQEESYELVDEPGDQDQDQNDKVGRIFEDKGPPIL